MERQRAFAHRLEPSRDRAFGDQCIASQPESPCIEEWESVLAGKHGDLLTGAPCLGGIVGDEIGRCRHLEREGHAVGMCKLSRPSDRPLRVVDRLVAMTLQDE
jgi:hypothetical protein